MSGSFCIMSVASFIAARKAATSSGFFLVPGAGGDKPSRQRLAFEIGDVVGDDPADVGFEAAREERLHRQNGVNLSGTQNIDLLGERGFGEVHLPVVAAIV